jgi:hypothetical protein
METGKLPIHRAEIHVTDSSIFRGCRLRWSWTSSLQHNLESISPPRALWFGTGVHYALERYYKDGLHPSEVFEAWAHEDLERIRSEWPHLSGEMDSFDEDVKLGIQVLAHYYSWAPQHDNFDVVSTERSFTIPDFIPPRVGYVTASGRILRDSEVRTEDCYEAEIHIDLSGQSDMVIQDLDGYWVMEHKTTVQVRDMNRLILEEQPGVYHAAMEQKLGVPIRGVKFNFLRKKAPHIPEPLKSGGLSVRANMDTTYEVYLAAIQAHGLDPKKYEDFLFNLQEKGNTFFYREDVVRSAKELKILFDRMRRVAEDMVSPGLSIYPSPDMLKCGMCPMQGPCIALADGSDWKFILDSQYAPRRRRSERTVVKLEEASIL